MECKLAKTAGFCFGVQRAVETVYEQIDKVRESGTSTPIYTFGPIIHNEQVVGEFEKQGVKVVNSEEELATLSEGILIIRSHGVKRSVQELAESRGLTVVDATCPFVKRIHKIVEKESNEGHSVLITGDPSHPEVQGIVGWCNGPCKVVSEAAEAIEFLDSAEGPVCVVSQTTFKHKKFQEIIADLLQKQYNANVVNTICNATQERQEEAEILASEADAMIVIGSAGSSNTRKLFEICGKRCKETYFVSTAEDLPDTFPEGTKLVGITAGASTPKNIIEEVQIYVRRF